jgi:hypothetical protein
MKLIARTALTALGVALCWALSSPPSDACTRCVYLGPTDTVLVARSMDWAEDPGTNLYCFPRGMKRDGATGGNAIKWTSKYGSVVCCFYEVGTVDGMNEKGFVANALYLVESDYGTPDGKKPTLTIAAWAQYVLDNYATVDDAVKELAKEPFTIIAPVLPNKMPAQGHLAISDPTGDSAIFEYVKGKLVIHHGKQYQVMTNSPTYDQQLALNTYWEQIGAAGDEPRSGSLRPGLVLYQRDSEDGRSQEGAGFGVQRDPRCFGSVGHHHAGPAEHCQHRLAHGGRSEEQGLLFRFGNQPDCLLGAAGRYGLQGRGRCKEVGCRRRQELQW